MNLQNKYPLLESLEKEVFQEWLAYLADQEHREKKVNEDHLVLTASMDLKVNQDSAAHQEEVFKAQLEKREKLALLVKLVYLEGVVILAWMACPVLMECLENR